MSIVNSQTPEALPTRLRLIKSPATPIICAVFALSMMVSILGCSGLISVQGGYMLPVDGAENHTGGGVDFMFGIGPYESNGGGGVHLSARGADKLFQIALGVHMWVVASHDWVRPYLRPRLAVAQFESVDDKFGFGMFSPGIEGGFLFGDEFFVVGVYTQLEYIFRFTEAPNRGYWLSGMVMALSF